MIEWTNQGVLAGMVVEGGGGMIEELMMTKSQGSWLSALASIGHAIFARFYSAIKVFLANIARLYMSFCEIKRSSKCKNTVLMLTKGQL